MGIGNEVLAEHLDIAYSTRGSSTPRKYLLPIIAKRAWSKFIGMSGFSGRRGVGNCNPGARPR